MKSNWQHKSWLKISVGVLIAAVVIVLAVLAVSDHEKLSAQIVEFESWVSSLGIWGPVAFACLFIALTSLLFPDTPLSAAAGAMFGTLVGTLVVVLSTIITQSIAFGLSRHYLQEPVRQTMRRWPKLVAIERAADRQGLKLQLLLRIAPLNQLLVSYVVATTKVNWADFLIGCLAITPTLTVQVYFGYAAAHVVKAASGVSEHSTIDTVSIVGGLVLCILLLVYVMRLAQRAIAEAEAAEVEPG